MEGTDFTHIFSRYLPHSYFNNSLPFPYSAMLFGHDCQTTWQNVEMDTEKFRNLQESERYDIFVSGTKKITGVKSGFQDFCSAGIMINVPTYSSMPNL